MTWRWREDDERCFEQVVDWDLPYHEILHREATRRLAILKSCLRSDDLKTYHLRRCRADYFYWRDNFCWTFDDDRGEIPYIDMPGHSKIQSVFLGLDGYRTPLGDLYNMALFSSRKRGKTVGHVSPISWDVLIQPDTKHYTVTAQQQSQVDNNTFVFSAAIFPKIRSMMIWTPAWMRPAAWKAVWKTHGNPKKGSGAARANRYLLIQNLETGSSVRGATANVNRERGGRAKRVWIDESNFIPRLDDLLGSITKVGPWAMSSSVLGRHTHFAKIVHGEVLPFADVGVSPGGVVVNSWHYSEHPLYDPETPEGAARIAAEKMNMTKEQWASEMENDFHQSVPGRIWGNDFSEDNLATTEEALSVIQNFDALETVEGWDFGVSISLTAVVWAAYSEATDTLYLLDYRQWRDGEADQIARDVANAGWETDEGGAKLPDERVGDPAGNIKGRKAINGRRMAVLESWITNLRSVGIDVRGQTLPIERAINVVRRKLKMGRILLMPAACKRNQDEPDNFPTVKDVFESYRRQLKQGKSDIDNFEGDAPKPVKDKFSHLADAIQHVAWYIWRDEG